MIQVTPDSFRYINPLCEDEFPGVTEFANRLQTWEWRFGKSPDFSIERNFSGRFANSHPYSVQVKLAVKKGRLATLEVEIDSSELDQLNHRINHFCLNSSGFQLTNDNVKDFEIKFKSCFSQSNDEQSGYTSEALWILKCIMSCLDFL